MSVRVKCLFWCLGFFCALEMFGKMRMIDVSLVNCDSIVQIRFSKVDGRLLKVDAFWRIIYFERNEISISVNEL